MVELMKPPLTAKLRILYGSQTGCAIEIAERLCFQARNRGFDAVVLSIDEYDRTNLINEMLVVFVTSTTGEGDSPDNFKNFWKFLLRKSLPKGILSNLRFATFGLGDSSYSKFNLVARKLHARLLQLGANEVCSIGLGDDQSTYGVDGDFDAWASTFWKAALNLYPIDESKYAINDSPVLIDFKLTVESIENRSENQKTAFYKAPLQSYPNCENSSLVDPNVGKVITNSRITDADWEQDVRHIEIQASAKLKYQAGDILILYPQNTLVDLDGLSKRLSLDLKQQIRITCGDDHLCCSIQELLVTHLDILGVPKRSFFQQLSFFATNEEEKEKLLELSSVEGTDLYHSYVTREKRTYEEVLHQFQSCQLSLQALVNLIPMLQPRSYSISSSPSFHQQILHLTVALVEYKTPYKRVKHGVMSHFLAHSLRAGDSVPFWIKPGYIKFPPTAAPLLMIGPGTGVAPMRSVLFEQAARGGERKLHLYFGCRNSTKDYYYKQDWEQLLRQNVLTQLQVAFSRSDNRCYVQQLLQQNAQDIYSLLVTQSGYCFVAGSAKKMPSDVRRALVEIFMSQGQIVDEKLAKKLLKRLELEGRFVVEAWS